MNTNGIKYWIVRVIPQLCISDNRYPSAPFETYEKELVITRGLTKKRPSFSYEIERSGFFSGSKS